ncbi:MAG: hypothetical protein M9890_14330 [Thermomicrobiales bacterium]|nr:hypothetical protein [Thermomicrobiales bacterium]
MITTHSNNLIQLTRWPLLFPVNVYLVREDDGFTLIDTGVWRGGDDPEDRASARRRDRADRANAR